MSHQHCVLLKLFGLFSVAGWCRGVHVLREGLYYANKQHATLAHIERLPATAEVGALWRTSRAGRLPWQIPRCGRRAAAKHLTTRNQRYFRAVGTSDLLGEISMESHMALGYCCAHSVAKGSLVYRAKCACCPTAIVPTPAGSPIASAMLLVAIRIARSLGTPASIASPASHRKLAAYTRNLSDVPESDRVRDCLCTH